ncbi:MAG: DUF4278 domain-containing protein [Oscillatoriales cyanobacterium RM1_1_9]|nr:DUF4278 domain-containing protein [Oscillatoriales cyanobacterium SM2_3_0]NJO44396.1 DUF4278 domain-containing protein [Oscillatoriales cyanobacterium RM2_1_1]NJO71589.1 DUF4278 domain-containing protein [Oscillatoriales cyanobacterium RM1_1_9]
MVLVYRGIAYQLSPAQPPISSTQFKGKYRGTSYWKQNSIALIEKIQNQSAHQLTYRGVHHWSEMFRIPNSQSISTTFEPSCTEFKLVS